jgi:DNA-directed RNA polymerase specialized sigma24 family protein
MGDVEQDVAKVIAGDAHAWSALQARIEPEVNAMARRHPSMRAKGLATREDDVAEVVVATLERLARDNFKNLRRFAEQNKTAPDSTSFDSWLYGATDFVIREHLRKRFGRAPKNLAPTQPQPSKRDLQSLAGRLYGENGDNSVPERSFIQTVSMTVKLTVAQIFEHIDQTFSAEEARALRMYYCEDRSFSEIASALTLEDDKSADRLLRRLNARLRYHFARSDTA